MSPLVVLFVACSGDWLWPFGSGLEPYPLRATYGQLEGAEVTTVEGLTPAGGLSVLQGAFRECHALQCGFCTAGMLATAHELLAENPAPTRQDIRDAIAGNLCMCTGYVNIVRAIELAARRLRESTAERP